MSEDEKHIFLNGIDGVTGNYLVQPMSVAEAVAMARGKLDDSELKGRAEQPSTRREKYKRLFPPA